MSPLRSTQQEMFDEKEQKRNKRYRKFEIKDS
jgi:hypothetical protein